MKKSRSDSKSFDMTSLSAPRRVPVPVLVRDGKRCPSPSSFYPTAAPDYGVNHHPTAFTSTSPSGHTGIIGTNPYNPQYPLYNTQYSSNSPNGYMNNNSMASMSPTMPQAGSQMTGFSSYNPQLVQQNGGCRWPW